MPTKIRKTKPAILNGLCLYRAKDGWRWKFMSQGRITAESGEAYTRKDKAKRAFKNMIERSILWASPSIWDKMRRNS